MKTLLPFVLMALLFTSCKKNKSTPTSVKFGEEEGVLYTKHFNEIEGTFNNPDYYEIDLNGDGLMDLRFSVGPTSNPSAGNIAEARVETLHPSCKVNVRRSIDTTFIFETFQLNTDPNGNQVGIESKTYSCERETPLYELDTVTENLRVVPNNINEFLSVDDPFQGGTYVFNPASYSSYSPNGIVFQGVTFYDLITVYNDCGAFPSGERFIGVKLYTYEGVKLGWVRVSVGSSVIRIKAWAIQP